MINNSLKHELDELKFIIAKEISASWNLSYVDIISFLVVEFKKSRPVEYPLEQRILSIISLTKPSLNISSKLEQKSLVSFNLE